MDLMMYRLGTNSHKIQRFMESDTYSTGRRTNVEGNQQACAFEFSLNVFTEFFKISDKMFVKKVVRTCNSWRKKPRCFHSASKRRGGGSFN